MLSVYQMLAIFLRREQTSAGEFVDEAFMHSSPVEIVQARSEALRCVQPTARVPTEPDFRPEKPVGDEGLQIRASYHGISAGLSPQNSAVEQSEALAPPQDDAFVTCTEGQRPATTRQTLLANIGPGSAATTPRGHLTPRMQVRQIFSEQYSRVRGEGEGVRRRGEGRGARGNWRG